MDATTASAMPSNDEHAPLLDKSVNSLNVDLSGPPKSPTLDARAIKRLHRLVGISFGSRSAVLSFVCLFAVALLMEITIYFIGMRTSVYFQLILLRDLPGFTTNTGILSLAFLLIGILRGCSKISGGIFALEARRILSTHLQGLLVSADNLYRVTKTHPYTNLVDNPDQRICQDTDKLTAGFRTLLEALIVTPLTIIFYTVMVWRVSDYLGPLVIYSYYLLSSLFSWLLMRPLVALIFNKDRAEGDYRYLHMHVRDHSEAISLERGYSAERDSLDWSLSQVITWQGRVVVQEAILSMGITVIAYTGGILCYVLVAIPVFYSHQFDDVPADKLSQIISLQTFTCIYLSSRFSGIITQAADVSDLAGYANRVGTMIETLNNEGDQFLLKTVVEEDGVKPGTRNGPPVETTPDRRDDFIVMRSAVISAPADPPRVLLSQLGISLRLKDRVILTGANGQGKSSIVRVLAGLWQLESGSLSLPAADVDVATDLEYPIHFMPQTPYLPEGSLRSLLCYPMAQADAPENITDAELLSLLDTVGLSGFADRMWVAHGSFDTDMRPHFWEANLSPGERQRLGFARTFYHLARRKRGQLSLPFLVMDEVTSSIDPETASRLFKTLAEAYEDIGWLRISHAGSSEFVTGESHWKLVEGILKTG